MPLRSSEILFFAKLFKLIKLTFTHLHLEANSSLFYSAFVPPKKPLSFSSLMLKAELFLLLNERAHTFLYVVYFCRVCSDIV